jgi:hypothetical protein
MKESFEINYEEVGNYFRFEQELESDIIERTSSGICKVYSNEFPFINVTVSIYSNYYSEYINDIRKVILSNQSIFEITYEYTFLDNYYFNVLVKVSI